MERRNTDEKKLLRNNIIQTDFKAQIISRDKGASAWMTEETQQEMEGFETGLHLIAST